MVLCVVVGCSSRSGREKGVSFYRIPTVVTTRGSAERELTQKRRDGYLAAISRDDLTEKILQNDRICAKHFISGKPAIFMILQILTGYQRLILVMSRARVVQLQMPGT